LVGAAKKKSRDVAEAVSGRGDLLLRVNLMGGSVKKKGKTEEEGNKGKPLRGAA